jgi:hypothetical protein
MEEDKEIQEILVQITDDIIPWCLYGKYYKNDKECMPMFSNDIFPSMPAEGFKSWNISFLSKCVLLFKGRPDFLKNMIKNKNAINEDKKFCFNALSVAIVNVDYLGVEPMEILMNEMSINDTTETLFELMFYFDISTELLKKIFKMGVDVNYRDYRGDTILISLCCWASNAFTNESKSYYRYIQLLLDLDADIYIRNYDGFDALEYIKDTYELFMMFAKKCGFSKIANVIEEKNDDMDKDLMAKIIKTLAKELDDKISMQNLLKEVSPFDALILKYL